MASLATAVLRIRPVLVAVLPPSSHDPSSRACYEMSCRQIEVLKKAVSMLKNHAVLHVASHDILTTNNFSEISQRKALEMHLSATYGAISAMDAQINARVILPRPLSGSVAQLSSGASFAWPMHAYALVMPDNMSIETNVNNEEKTTSTLDVLYVPSMRCTQERVALTPATRSEPSPFHNTILGGTFDRMQWHTGHKILLSMSALVTDDAISIGVTDDVLLSNKFLSDLIETVEKRSADVEEFLNAVRPGLHIQTFPIVTPEGPTTEREEYDSLVVSEETKSGSDSINIQRVKKGWHPLDVIIVSLVPNATFHSKVSSSELRLADLGRFFGRSHPNPKRSPEFSRKPYVIGLCGGIASGKSSIAKHLQTMFNAKIIDCDKLGHQAYAKGSPGFDKVVAAFGSDLIGPDGEIDRKKLGALVFTQSTQSKPTSGSSTDTVSKQPNLLKLESIVWPEIQRMIEAEIDKYGPEDIVVVEAAILIEAGWHDNGIVDEVWVSFIPENEAVDRIMRRNHLDAPTARSRIAAQMSNKKRLSFADVALSTIFPVDETKVLVAKAWQGVQQRHSAWLHTL